MIIKRRYVSSNFTYNEVVKSQTAIRLGIDNTPNDSQLAFAKTTAAKILEPVRFHYKIGFSPSSWFRCIELNRILKSADTSQHVLGKAVDFEVPGISNLEVAQWIADNLQFDQLILEHHTENDPTSGWIHVSYNALEINRNVISTYKNGVFLNGLPKIH